MKEQQGAQQEKQQGDLVNHLGGAGRDVLQALGKKNVRTAEPGHRREK